MDRDGTYGSQAPGGGPAPGGPPAGSVPPMPPVPDGPPGDRVVPDARQGGPVPPVPPRPAGPVPPLPAGPPSHAPVPPPPRARPAAHDARVPPPMPGWDPGPSPRGAVPERPPGADFLDWLRTPRPPALPGIWRFGHRPRPEVEPEQVPGRQLVSGALLALLVGWLFWSLLYNGYLWGNWWQAPLTVLIKTTPLESQSIGAAYVSWIYILLVAALVAVMVARLGRWPELWRRYSPWSRARREADSAASPPPAPAPQEDPAQWPELRAAGEHAVADKLADEAHAGRLRDVDHARLVRAWRSVQSGQLPAETFRRDILRDGAAAFPHPSGRRDLPARSVPHDLATGQVRLGATLDDAHNPYAYRTAGFALGSELLATSLVAVGPAGSGKTGALVRPVAEALCLQALAGRAAVVVVGAEGASLGHADNYDIVIRLGHPDSVYDLDLYGGTHDAEEAATFLAEALVGDLPQASSSGRRPSTVLAQVLGPFRAVHGRFPSVPELRLLLDGSPKHLAALRAALAEAGHSALLRDVESRERQAGQPGDAAPLLVDRLALLDRPAFADFFDTSGEGAPFSFRALDHPVRVRIELPARSHPDASRVLARLVLAQFTASVLVRGDLSLFACLVLDDAAGVVTGASVRGIQSLRSAHAGVLLALRTLDDVPQELRGPLLGAAGCRMALSGVAPRDGQDFAAAWGTEWREIRDVTDRQIVADEPLTKVSHFLRKAITGKAPTAQSVTVRQVERERWSASELAHALPPGHAVVSLTTVRGEHAPPLLVDLRH
ncbi:ATP-binding protein [Streptomyces sp. CA-253872]|uniref:ATP-binding protein n=1 Tax=Streptomyces sp. CA-253872 TaxID=3240067 RepID=UPI003D8CAF58